MGLDDLACDTLYLLGVGVGAVGAGGGVDAGDSAQEKADGAEASAETIAARRQATREAVQQAKQNKGLQLHRLVRKAGKSKA